MSASNEASTRDALIIDGSMVNGKVLLVEYDDKAQITSREVVKDAAFFNMTVKGDFIYRSQANTWLYGNVKKPESLASLTSVPQGSTYAALSPNGKTVLWRLERGKVSSLISTNLETGERRTLVSETGFIKVPAWSPKANSVVYYSGQPDALVNGKYALGLVRLSGASNEVTQLTPASYPTGITADRTVPPSWSPDGVNILFVGNYEGDDVIKACSYVVRADGTGRQRVEGGVWSAAGTHLLIVRRKQLPFGPLVLATFNLSTGTSSDVSLPFDLPMSIGNGTWRRDGRMFGFITEEGEVSLIDVTKKKKSKLMDFMEGAKILWLE